MARHVADRMTREAMREEYAAIEEIGTDNVFPAARSYSLDARMGYWKYEYIGANGFEYVISDYAPLRAGRHVAGV